MRYLLTILSLVILSVPVWSADQPVAQNSIAGLLEKVPTSIVIARADLDEKATTINVHLKKGFRLALVYDRNADVGMYCDDVAKDALLIMAVSPTKVIGIYQEDTTAKLGIAEDALEQQSIQQQVGAPPVTMPELGEPPKQPGE